MTDSNDTKIPMDPGTKLVKAEDGNPVDATYYRSLIGSLRWAEKRITLKVDNVSAIALVRNPVFHGRSKHIDIRYHFIRECVENRHINVEHVSGELQRADILTKALPRLKFVTMRQMLGVLFSDDFRRSFGKLMGSCMKKQILKQFKVEGFYVICTNDIIKEVKYVQVLKVWDVLALDEIPKLTKRLESIFSAYTYAYISRCTEKCFEGTLEVSKTWPASEEIIRYRYLSECENESKGSVNPGDARIFVENSKVSESLLPMKFYSNLTCVVEPYCNLCEQKFRIASDGIYEGENNRFREVNDIPDTFTNIPVSNYPLVITFQKFLMMLDGTLSNSFFERFLEAREGYHGNRISSRSVALQTFIRLREVTFDRFCSFYWPHFNSTQTKKLDPSRVFTEIISHIKGGLQAGECSDGKLGYDRYCLLAESRSSTLTREKREIVYTIYETYEKMKTERGEFDLGDLVNDIHHRLENGNYEGDKMDLVLYDEAQTIARGIDFRFQDIRSLFYKEFLSTKTSGKKDKGLVSEIFQLKQNFRTHAAVLDLAQSVIDIIYCYFLHSIDKVEPEISLISGETPVLLEYGSDENAIITIFGDTRTNGQIVGFGDVLLYNFFGTSPLKDHWRVVYDYMNKHNWVDDKLPKSFRTFSEERRSVLCFELKQLYVAITRTRQRLWICENKEELSKPMFDYWKLRGLVQIRKLDASVARAMRVKSNPREWRERGKKFFYENNFLMAIICFERAGDTMWEKLAKASDLRASADRMRQTNHEAFLGYVREAAEMFESIGKHESAASCYCDLGEYERAAKPQKLTPRRSVFQVSSVCKERKLFDKGLEYIKYQKENVNAQSKEIRKIEQESMMRFVQEFYSMESKRVFLTSVGCLNDLILLEEASGELLEAAELASLLGDVIREADLLEKVGHFKEAAALLLWYVYFSSLWCNGNSGWPLKQFSQKEVYCEKTKWLAKLDSDAFSDFVNNELNILSDHYNSFPELKHALDHSQKNRSLRGEILLIRKILDAHFRLKSSKYEWEDELPVDIYKHCSDKMFQNQVSVRTLVFNWNIWQENVVHLFDSLGSFHDKEPNKDELYVDFSLNYFGVRKHNVNGNMVYLLVNKDAEWVRKWGQKGLHMDGKLLTIDGRELVFAVRSYWQSELVFVGIKVLETLEALCKSKSNSSVFRQSTSLLHIFEVSKFLLGCQYLKLTNPYKKKLQYFLGISLTYFDLVFPLDWRKSVSKDLISLRETDLSVKLLDEIIHQSVDIKGDFTYRTIGRVMMIYERPKIHAPCAIFVDLRNSREEVMSVLFQTKSTLCAQNPWNDNGCGTIAEVTYALATALEDGEFCTGEDTTIVHGVFSELKVLLEPFDKCPQRVSSCEQLKNLKGVFDLVRRSGPTLSYFLMRYARSQDPKCGQTVVSNSSITDAVVCDLYY
ncbi:UvrD-like helicase, ATP-binding domain, P-loop containing nucleoside triphosphate hydrolase [Tanacetum coccineum]